LAAVSVIMNFLMTPVFSLLPLLVTRHFDGGVWQLSLLQSAMGIGLVGGGVLMGLWGGFRSKVATLAVGVVGIGVSVLALGILPKALFIPAVTGMFIGSMANSMCNATLFSILQARIPPDMQGRTFSILMSLSGMMAPLGLLVSAPAADYLGIQFWYAMAGSITLAIAVFLGLSKKVLASMDGLSDPAVSPLKESVSMGQAGD
jgi:MFS transporter, DHA3 family, macrolide efflux protein